MKIQDMKTELLFPDDYAVLDLEMTGLEAGKDEITEIGIVKVRQGEIVDTFETLIRPKQYIKGYIAKKTGITNEMVKDKPSIEEVLPKALEFIGEDVIVGQNIRFDVLFLDTELGKELPNTLVDTLRIAKILLPAQRHRLSDLVSFFHIENDLAFHRALNDVINTYKVFEAEKDMILSKYVSYEAFLENPKPLVAPTGVDIKNTETLSIYSNKPWQVKKDNESQLYPPYIWNRTMMDVSSLYIDYEDPSLDKESLLHSFIYKIEEAKQYPFFKDLAASLNEKLVRMHSHLSEKERKDSKSVICFTMIEVKDYLRYQKLGMKVYHIVDVLNFLRQEENRK